MKLSLTLSLLLLLATNAWSDDTTGSVVEQDLMKGLAEIDFLVENSNQHSSIAIGSNNSSLVWGWCDDLGTKDEAKKCALSKCPEDSCEIVTVNGEAVNKDILKEFLINRNLQDVYKTKEDDYEKRKLELYNEMSSPHWSDGLAEGVVRGLFVGLIIIAFLIFAFKKGKKIKGEK
tara:strand:- start:2361 stop:2885 length:525 start_codon:yes stop_codon:yes gene_type:complete